jgi:hypothetical protein
MLIEQGIVENFEIILDPMLSFTDWVKLGSTNTLAVLAAAAPANNNRRRETAAPERLWGWASPRELWGFINFRAPKRDVIALSWLSVGGIRPSLTTGSMGA